MLWLLTGFLGMNVPMIFHALKARHWKDVSVQFILVTLSIALTVSFEWDIPQLLFPFSWMRRVFEHLSNVLYQPF